MLLNINGNPHIVVGVYKANKSRVLAHSTESVNTIRRYTFSKMLHKILTFLCVSLMIMMISGHIGGHISLQDVKDIKPQKFCGPKLANTLAIVCYFREGGVRKRTGVNMIYRTIMGPVYKEREMPFFPWILTEKARSLDSSSRGKRFVVDECCFKACTVEELASYC